MSVYVTIGRKKRAIGREGGGKEGGSEGDKMKEEMRSFLRKGAANRTARTSVSGQEQIQESI